MGTARSSQFPTQNLFPKISREYYPLRYDMGDTQKLPQLSAEEYEELAEEREDRILMDMAIDDPKSVVTAGGESGVDEDDLGAAANEAESKEDNEKYAAML